MSSVAHAVNGNMIATLHLGNKSWQYVFYVLRESTQAALLSLDFLLTNHAWLDLAHGRLQLWDVSIIGKELVPECCNISIATAMTIPPFSQMLVPANVSPAGHIEPLPDFVDYLAHSIPPRSECAVEHTVTAVKGEVTPCWFVEPCRPEHGTDRGGMHLGEFSSVDESNVGSLPQTSPSTVSTASSAGIPFVSQMGPRQISSRKSSYMHCSQTIRRSSLHQKSNSYVHTCQTHFAPLHCL